MQEYTFKAKRFDEALLQVRNELGPDAVIISSKQLTPTRALGGQSKVEVRAISRVEASQRGLIHEDEEFSNRSFTRRLRKIGIPQSVAKNCAMAVIQYLGRMPSSLQEAKVPLQRALEKEMVFSGPIQTGSNQLGSLGKKGPRTVALTGGTGVGKTTTIAKIAARSALIEKKKVSLISFDHYRIGGTDQLQRYAELIGISMEVAHDLRSLEIGLRKCEDADLVLVDTAGRSPKDYNALKIMAECLQGVQEPIEVHLCVPTSIGEHELRLTAERHQILHPTKLIMTKLDEAIYHGSIVAAQSLVGLPFSYFTTGQKVPEDFEVASAERLACWLCDEEVQTC